MSEVFVMKYSENLEKAATYFACLWQISSQFRVIFSVWKCFINVTLATLFAPEKQEWKLETYKLLERAKQVNVHFRRKEGKMATPANCHSETD